MRLLFLVLVVVGWLSLEVVEVELDVYLVVHKAGWTPLGYMYNQVQMVRVEVLVQLG